MLVQTLRNTQKEGKKNISHYRVILFCFKVNTNAVILTHSLRSCMVWVQSSATIIATATPEAGWFWCFFFNHSQIPGFFSSSLQQVGCFQTLQGVSYFWKLGIQNGPPISRRVVSIESYHVHGNKKTNRSCVSV